HVFDTATSLIVKESRILSTGSPKIFRPPPGRRLARGGNSFRRLHLDRFAVSAGRDKLTKPIAEYRLPNPGTYHALLSWQAASSRVGRRPGADPRRVQRPRRQDRRAPRFPSRVPLRRRTLGVV